MAYYQIFAAYMKKSIFLAQKFISIRTFSYLLIELITVKNMGNLRVIKSNHIINASVKIDICKYMFSSSGE